ncbi:MAG: HAD hydrolase-like protein [Nanoarchaeota archaeon]
MVKLKSLYFDLDGVLWIPDDFLQDALYHCINKGKESGLNLDLLDEGIILTYIIREAMGSNAQNHFDILVDICNGTHKELYSQVFEADNPIKIIKDNFSTDYSINFDTKGKQNYFIVQSMAYEYTKAKLSNMKPVMNIEETLDECLKEGYAISVITNGISTKQLNKLDELGLTHYFRQKETEPEVRVIDKHIQVSDEDKSLEKPNPYMWTKQREQFVRYSGTYFPNKEAHIGDCSWNDILGSNSLGIFSIKVNQGKKKYETIEDVLHKKGVSSAKEKYISELLEPDAVIQKTSELLCALHKIERKYDSLLEKKRYQQSLAKSLNI